jgi:hypothetical protein
MQMNPKYYYDNFVKPNYDEFCADEGSIRKAFNAVISLFHMTDNYFNYYKRRGDAKVAGFNDLRDFQVHMGGLTPYFNDVQSMANAYKHLYTNSGKAHVTVESSGAVYVEEVTENEDSTDSVDLEGAACRSVYYLKKDGSSLEVKVALSEVIEAWGTLF